MRAVERMVHGLEAAVRLFGGLAACVCVVLVLLVTGDVMMRYFFRVGAVWLQELQWHLISPIALFGISYALYRGEQVRVDVFFEHFPEGVKRVVEVMGGLMLMAIALYSMWLCLPWVEQSWLRNEASPNPGGLPWRWVLKAFLPLGFLLLAMQSLAHVLRHGFALSKKEGA